MSTKDLAIEGPISEKASFFETPIDAFKEINLNMSKVTFINSIGVKNWILWTCKIPPGSVLNIHECPFVIVNQINTVQGFLPKGARVKSFLGPFICESCSNETTIKMVEGTHYKYPAPGSEPMVKIPEDQKCSKCGEVLEADFFVEKSFGFLKLP